MEVLVAQAQPVTAEAAMGFDAFVRERRPGLWRAAWLLTADRHKADDLVQTALARTYGRYELMSNDAKFEAYVRTTIYRTYVSWWRRRWNAELPSTDLPERPTASFGAGNDRRYRSTLLLQVMTYWNYLDSFFFRSLLDVRFLDILQICMISS